MKCPKCRFENPDTQRFCGECGTQLPTPKEIPVAQTETLQTPIKELTTGSTFAGRYQVIEELGKGGMGKVYKVFDTEVKEKVALKLLKPEIAADKETVERFRNELKFARKIRHKNVCQMFDLAKEESTYYITMEYVGGEDLKSMIRMSKKLSIGTAVDIARQVCEGLAEAHKLGVIHRDLKPQYIMIDREGNARIMDFGIARSLRGKSITGAGVMIGTPEYMSPEQVEGKDVDQRSDIYSLGVILYEMVTGRVPFEGDTPFTIGMKHKSEIPKDPKELNAQIPEDLSRIVLKCLEKDKVKRYQSAEELRVELEKIEKGIPTTERETPARRPFTSKEITVTFKLKKLFVPVSAVLILIIAAVIIWQVLIKKRAVGPLAVKQSIAILPFTDLSQQKDQSYLCAGFAESIINALSKIKDLYIPASTSSFSLTGKNRNIQEIGQMLHVSSVLDGSLQRAGNRIRVIAKLINTADESILWSEQFDEEIQDIFAIQDKMTQGIVDNLKLKILGEEKAKLKKRYTENLEAYNLYLQGRYFWSKRTKEGLVKALEYFNQAIERDPNYALAYVGVADVYNMRASYRYLRPKEAYPMAKAAAMKALEIDYDLAEAYTSLARAKRHFDLDWQGAEQDFKKAISLNPGYSTAHLWYSDLLRDLGRMPDAIVEAKRACELDPLSLVVNTNLAWVLYFNREYEKAIESCKKVIEMDPGFFWAHSVLGDIYVQKSMFEEATIELKKGGDLYLLARCYGFSGKRKEALEILQRLENRADTEYVALDALALIYLSLGEKEKALEYFDKALIEKDVTTMVFIKVDPYLDGLRADPRFKALLKKVGLEK
jgi:serine/threonine protein kinase/Tfp pilus assembly protein PilF